MIAACVKNDRGDLLPYTAQSTLQGCKEHAEKFWGPEVWSALQRMGCKIVQIEIREIHE
jgi:hypothetical protein